MFTYVTLKLLFVNIPSPFTDRNYVHILYLWIGLDKGLKHSVCGEFLSYGQKKSLSLYQLL